MSLGLVIFGLLTGFSIGQSFLLVGLTMLLLGAFRHRPLVFWPPMLAVIAYNITYWAIAPSGCTWTVATAGVERTVCSNLLGLPYEGEGIYNPQAGGSGDEPPLRMDLLGTNPGSARFVFLDRKVSQPTP